MIYKICTQESWSEACAVGRYNGSADDLRDGFIHFSTFEQLRGTVDKHFAGRKNLLLIGVKSNELGAELKWEPSRGGALFPHLYAPLPTAAAAFIQPLELDASGRHVLPESCAVTTPARTSTNV